MVAGTRIEPGMVDDDPTVDSHVRFMGAIFAGYGLNWLGAASPTGDVARMRTLAGLMALGGAARLGTRARMGRPHRFHDLLLAIELAAPGLVEVAARNDRRALGSSAAV